MELSENNNLEASEVLPGVGALSCGPSLLRTTPVIRPAALVNPGKGVSGYPRAPLSRKATVLSNTMEYPRGEVTGVGSSREVRPRSDVVDLSDSLRGLQDRQDQVLNTVVRTSARERTLGPVRGESSVLRVFMRHRGADSLGENGCFFLKKNCAIIRYLCTNDF